MNINIGTDVIYVANFPIEIPRDIGTVTGFATDDESLVRVTFRDGLKTIVDRSTLRPVIIDNEAVDL